MKSKSAVPSFTVFLLLTALAAPAHATSDDAAWRVGAAYTGDILSNLSGGIRRTSRYLDNLDITLEVDGERAFGWPDATFFIYGLYNNGTRFSETVVGDAQVVSNIETGVQAVRLYEAWLDQRFADDRASLRLGLYDLNSEFDAIAAAGLFINSAHGIGTDIAQTGESGPSIFPVTSVALRGDYAFGDQWLVRAVVLDGVPGDPDHPRRTAIKFRDGDGALVAAEVNFEGEAVRAGFGYWRYSGRFENIVMNKRRRGNDGFYGFVETSLSDRFSLFARAGRASERFNMFGSYLGAGAVAVGLVPERPDDALGFAIAWAETGAPFRSREAAEEREVTLELTYRAPLHPYLTVQPDIQYVINPGADRGLRDALIFGLRFELAWEAEG